MSEKLDTNTKNLIAGILGQGWNYFYMNSVMVLYEELPPIELVRAVTRESVIDGKREIEIDNEVYFCMHFSRNLYHWKSNHNSVLYSPGFLKGNEAIYIVSCKNYAQGCKILYQVKARISQI